MSDGNASAAGSATAATPGLAAGRLHFGDNLPVLRELADASVDLAYLDPPFCSQARYQGARGDGAFDDVWRWDGAADAALAELACAGAGGAAGVREAVAGAVRGLELILGRGPMLAYLVAMAQRLVEVRRALAATGSVYVHCDGSASHYLKVLLDAVHGPACFLNNVVWLYGLGGSSPRYWPRKHDDLLWYARTPGRQHFEPALTPARSVRMRGLAKKVPDWWDIPALNNMAAERVGYPTQKPLALLERIVASSCPAGGVVLDPCCGSGTTLVAAQRLGRRWIGIDASAAAIATARQRLERGH